MLQFQNVFLFLQSISVCLNEFIQHPEIQNSCKSDPMKTITVSVLFCLFTITSFSQANTWSVKFTNAIRTRWTESVVSTRVCVDKMTSKGWEYSNAIIMHGIEKVYNNVNTAAYRTYIKTYVDSYVNASGAINASIISLDKLHPAISLLFLYEDPATSAADKARYKTAADFSRNILVGPSATYPKTAYKGIFWHKNNGSYDNIVMLDGIYMAHPFLAKYGRMFNDNAAIDTAVNQTLFVYNQLYDPVTHLIKHAWNPTKVETWANSTTGNSTSVWSRAMGWYVMALVDIIKYVPTAHPRRGELIDALNNLAIGMKNYQDPASKLWFQVVTKTDLTLSGNFIETSGSAMFIYALKVASDNGWISSATYLPVAQSAWTGLQAQIDNYPTDNMPRINNFAPAMSVQNTEALYTQASLQPVDCPATAHPHGYAAILMAASAMEFSQSPLPVAFISFSVKKSAGNVLLSWEMADDGTIDHYEPQRSTDGTNFTSIGTVHSTGGSAYTWTDNSKIETRTCYRIKAVSANGQITYSQILFVKENAGNSTSMQVSPNPAKNGVVNISVTNLPAGTYSVQIISSAGKLVEEKTLNATNAQNMGQAIQLPAGTPDGLYFVQLRGNDININKTIFINR
jgi:unsaturated rhamnogalacturonyl hydrolase